MPFKDDACNGQAFFPMHCARTHTRAPAHTDTHTPLHMHFTPHCARAHTHIFTHVRMHMRTQILKHSNTPVCMHAHAHARMLAPLRGHVGSC